MVFRTNRLFEESLFQVSPVTRDIHINNLSLCQNNLVGFLVWLLMFHSVGILFSLGFCCFFFCFGWISFDILGFKAQQARGCFFRTFQNFFSFFLERFQLPVKIVNCFSKIFCETAHTKHSVETHGSAFFWYSPLKWIYEGNTKKSRSTFPWSCFNIDL